MATLQSPGVQITVIDESFYASAGNGTVPLIIVATAQDKLVPSGDAVAAGTTKAQANVLQAITSRRELTQVFGAPFFENVNGSIVQGSEINEYGLHAAYQYLGIANRALVLRADIDLAQLAYTQTMPSSAPTNGTYWFDTLNTSFGIFRANGNATAGLAWDSVTVLIPSDSEIDVSDVPLSSFGDDGDIAVVVQTNSNTHYEKISGTWYEIGDATWKAARPTVALGTVTNPTVTAGHDIVINGTTVTLSGTTLTSVISDITGAGISGITAADNNDRLEITLSTGEDIILTSTTGTALADLGIEDAFGYKLNYATHINIPNGEHAGDIWVKTTNPNFGADYVVKRYSTSTDQFAIITAPMYVDDTAADTAYGTAKDIGSLYVQYNTTGTSNDPIATSVIKRWDGSAWSVLVYEAGSTAPTNAPEEGTLWINDSLRVDIMVNDGDEWKGYLNEFPNTDPAGVQITSEEPTTQSDGTPLEANDLWIDSADVENYPALYRWDATQWVAVDKTDQTTPFGIVFADARANDDGSLTGSEENTDMLVSDYVDAGTPNPQTYPAGMLLFNTRYATNNVKEWQPNFYAGQGAYTVGLASFPAPTNLGRWVTKSGNNLDGSPRMGRFAQHNVVVEAMAEAIITNDDIRSEFVTYNLLAAPGYPELRDEMASLNIDKKETAFIITEPPMRLAPSGTSLTNWATNVANVASTNDEGRTNRYTYSAEYYPHGLSTNLDGEEVVVPSSTIALRTYAYSDSVAYPWLSPAGTQRGVVDSATNVGYITSEGEFSPVRLSVGQRDVLYTNNMNPIANLPSRGLVVYGDKTLHPDDSALDRVNVARLVCYIRAQLDRIVQPFLFQNNTETTRAAAQAVVSKFMADLLALEALEDFAVVCDSSNNTPERRDRNELWIDVAFAPTKSINFIYIPMRIRGSGEI